MQQNDKGGRNGRDEDRGDRADAATDGHTAAAEGVLLRAGDDVEKEPVGISDGFISRFRELYVHGGAVVV